MGAQRNTPTLLPYFLCCAFIRLKKAKENVLFNFRVKTKLKIEKLLYMLMLSEFENSIFKYIVTYSETINKYFS